MDEILKILEGADEEGRAAVKKALTDWKTSGRPGVFRYISDEELRKEMLSWKVQDITVGAITATAVLIGGYLIYKKLRKKKTEEK